MTETHDSDVHGENTCADVEAMLTEVSEALDGARDENAMLMAADAARQAEMDALRLSSARRDALFAEMRKKVGNLSDQHEGLDTQVTILLKELEAAEADAVPADSLTHGIISHSEVVAAYRAASGVTRGPVPPVIAAAVEAAAETIRARMEEAGRAALAEAMTGAVRARNVSLGLTPTGRPRRGAPVAGRRGAARAASRSGASRAAKAA